jgi:hypothetical protein
MTPSGLKPSGTCCSATRLRTSSAAPISSTVASASSAAASPFLNTGRPPPVAERPASFSAVLTSVFAACHAGARPKTTPVSSVTPIANATTRGSTPTSGTGSTFGGSVDSSQLTAHVAPSRPSTPPMPESTTLSTRSCRIRRPRPAPSAARTAISLWRSSARASSRFATFALTIRSTHTTAPSSTSSAVRNWLLTNVSVKVTRLMPQSFTSGYCWPTRRAMASISACAAR